MKIGIVTMPLFANYGGVLQNYALQKVLKDLGHEPITFDYQRSYSFYNYLRSILKTTLLWFIPWKRRPFVSYHTYITRPLCVDTFIQKHIILTSPIECFSSNLIEKYNLDAIITGSDQVWRPQYNPNEEDMFLKFVSQSNVKRIAYAASFGIDQWSFSSQLTQKCIPLAQRMNAISVREKSGIDLCKKYLNVEAIQVLDPTLLLDREDYEILCRDIPFCETSFIAAYILDMNKYKREYIETVSEEQNLPVKYFSSDRNLSLSVEEWLAMFRDAKYVITDSFHGTVFSIIFNKPFITIGNSTRGMDRFVSLLKIFDLEECLISQREVYRNKIIRWKVVNEIRRSKQADSVKFLANNL